MVKILIIDILFTVETSRVTCAKWKRVVHLFILAIKIVFEAPEGGAEEMRLRKKVQPLQSLILQKSDLKT